MCPKWVQNNSMQEVHLYFEEEESERKVKTFFVKVVSSIVMRM